MTEFFFVAAATTSPEPISSPDLSVSGSQAIAPQSIQEVVTEQSSVAISPQQFNEAIVGALTVAIAPIQANSVSGEDDSVTPGPISVSGVDGEDSSSTPGPIFVVENASWDQASSRVTSVLIIIDEPELFYASFDSTNIKADSTIYTFDMEP